MTDGDRRDHHGRYHDRRDVHHHHYHDDHYGRRGGFFGRRRGIFGRRRNPLMTIVSVVIFGLVLLCVLTLVIAFFATR